MTEKMNVLNWNKIKKRNFLIFNKNITTKELRKVSVKQILQKNTFTLFKYLDILAKEERKGSIEEKGNLNVCDIIITCINVFYIYTCIYLNKS